MRLLIAPDSFKGTLSSTEVCQMVEEILGHSFAILAHPLADGGERTLEAIAGCLPDAQWITQKVMGPLPDQRVEAKYLWLAQSQTAFIEMAQASGLTLLKPSELNPALTTTFGTGELIKNALNQGAKKLYLAIGGSATNDAGVGMLMALGWQFLDSLGNSVNLGGNELVKIQQIIPPNGFQLFSQGVEIFCDVTNPLYGNNGAAQVFGKQKGADENMIKNLDQGLRHFRDRVEQQLGINVNFPGAGAAGGLGAGTKLGFDAKISRGIERIAELTGLEANIQASDVIITGEGQFDQQSLQGKVIYGVLTLAQKNHKPLILLTGNSDFKHYAGIQKIITLVGEDVSLESALNDPKTALRKRCQELRAYLTHLSVL
jgi:glycerate 2-kinase